MKNTPGTRQHTLRTFRNCTFRSVGAAALFGSLALAACSGSYSTQETADDDPGAPATTNTPAAPAPASNTPARPAAATPAAATSSTPSTPAAATPAASNPAPAAANPPAAAPAAGNDTPAPAAAASVSFATDVWPILNADCGPCHVDQNAGGHNAGSTDKAAALKDAIRVDTGIVSEIQAGGMPLGCGKPPGGGGNCVSAADFATIQDWVKAGTPP